MDMGFASPLGVLGVDWETYLEKCTVAGPVPTPITPGVYYEVRDGSGRRHLLGIAGYNRLVLALQPDPSTEHWMRHKYFESIIPFMNVIFGHRGFSTSWSANRWLAERGPWTTNRRTWIAAVVLNRISVLRGAAAARRDHGNKKQT